MKSLVCSAILLVLTMVAAAAAQTENQQKTYLLRYQYKPGETIRWQVEHRSKVRATVSKSTQTTETLSISMKAWRVSEVKPDGTATFEHLVEWVDMRQQLTGRAEIRYDSRTDKTPPEGYKTAAASVGVPLAVITMDPSGKIVQRKDLRAQPKPAPAGDGGPDWPDRVMASVRALGPLPAASPQRIRLWAPAAALAASLAILAAWYAVNDLHANVMASEMFLNDPAGMTFVSLLAEP